MIKIAELQLEVGTRIHTKVVAFGGGRGIYLPVDAERWADLKEGTEIVLVLENSKKYGNYIGIGKKKA